MRKISETNFVCRPISRLIIASMFATGIFVPLGAGAASAADRNPIEVIVADWPERPRLGAVEMIAKYGQPQEATTERLVWHNAGLFKRISVFKLETPHDFPLPHVDFLEHTVTYNVPQNKVADLIKFDASSTINRTVGELSARCDLEGHNILTLNLNHDIVTGKKTVEQARKAFGEFVEQDVTGKHPAYVEALQFQPATEATAAFSDKPIMLGSPVRAADNDADSKAKIVANKGKERDAEILATVIAIDINEVLAAAEAQKKQINQKTLDYAKMLHQAHGESMSKTMKVSQQIGVTPVNTTSVEKLQVKGAGELAALVPLNGSTFEQGYITAMVKGHTEVLAMIDGELLSEAKHDILKKLLTEKRTHVALHLEKAKEIQRN